MTYKQIVKKLTPLLKEVTHIPQKEVEILLLNILDKNPIWLHINYDKECDCEKELEKQVKKRATHYPLEYITKKANFYGLPFHVEQNVLIPRPETELLVEKALEILKKEDRALQILEIGIGSGIISTMLALELENVSITAIDINDDAIALAKKNFEFHKVEDKIKLIKSDLFTNIDDKKFDVIISNPPYIKNSYELPQNVKYEPKNALFGGEIGDELLIKIIDGCAMRKIPYLFCEMGYDQKQPLQKYLKQYKTKFVEFYEDYSQFDRGFLVEFDYE